MRTVVGVVVGIALLVAGGVASAADAPKTTCPETCEAEFDTCRFRSGQKNPGECATRLIFCKKACPGYTPAVTDPSAPPPPRSCREACEDGFENCIRREGRKQAGQCPTELLVCRQKCPPEAPPAPDPGAGTTASGTSRAAEETATPVDAGTGPAAGGERGSTPTAVAPRAEVPAAAPPPPSASGAPQEAASGTGQVAPGVVAAPQATVASEAVAAPAGASPRVAPKTEERSFWCRWTPFCGPQTSSGPRNCVELCNEAYDACQQRAIKRPGECQTNAIVCRQKCEKAPPAAAP